MIARHIGRNRWVWLVVHDIGTGVWIVQVSDIPGPQGWSDMTRWLDETGRAQIAARSEQEELFEEA